jgi:hypothetical protein
MHFEQGLPRRISKILEGLSYLKIRGFLHEAQLSPSSSLRSPYISARPGRLASSPQGIFYVNVPAGGGVRGPSGFEGSSNALRGHGSAKMGTPEEVLLMIDEVAHMTSLSLKARQWILKLQL